MKNDSEIIQYLSEKMRAGEMTAEQANVEKVRIKRVFLVTCRMPAQVRAALRGAVKTGELGHVKKDGLKPEAYYHPTFNYMVAGARCQHERAAIQARIDCAKMFS